MGYPEYPQQQGYHPQPYEDPFERKGSPGLAVFSAIVGLGVAGVFAWQTLALLDLLGPLKSQMPGSWTGLVVGHFVIAFLALVGAVLVFARMVAGAFVLLFSAVLTIAAIVTAPLIADGIGYTLVDARDVVNATDVVDAAYPTLTGNALYFHQLFEFDNTQATLRFAALALGVILLVIAALPPSLNWLRGRRKDGYSPRQAGW